MTTEVIDLAVDGKYDIGILRLDPYFSAVVFTDLITNQRTGALLMISVEAEEGAGQGGQLCFLLLVSVIPKIVQPHIAQDDESIPLFHLLPSAKRLDPVKTAVGCHQ